MVGYLSSGLRYNNDHGHHDMIMLFFMTAMPWSCYISWWPIHDFAMMMQWLVWITMIIPCHSMFVMFVHGCQPGQWDKNFSTENRGTPSFAINKEIIDGSDACRKPSETRFKAVVLFLTVCKITQNICSWARNMPVPASRLLILCGIQTLISLKVLAGLVCQCVKGQILSVIFHSINTLRNLFLELEDP